jgi:LPXTG-motif cell wall-anchored protein
MNSEPEESTEEEKGFGRSGWFFWLLAAGFGLVFAGGLILVLAAAFGGGFGSSGVVIFIGPFPIVFGAGTETAWLILIGLAIAVASVVLFWVGRRKLREEEG